MTNTRVSSEFPAYRADKKFFLIRTLAPRALPAGMRQRPEGEIRPAVMFAGEYLILTERKARS